MTFRRLKKGEAEKGLIIYQDNFIDKYVIIKVINRGFYNQLTYSKVLKNGRVAKRKFTGIEEDFFINPGKKEKIKIQYNPQKTHMINYLDSNMKGNIETFRQVRKGNWYYTIAKHKQKDEFYIVRLSSQLTNTIISKKPIEIYKPKVKSMTPEQILKYIKIYISKNENFSGSGTIVF